MNLKEWLPYTIDQQRRLNNLAQRLNITYDNNSFDFIQNQYWGLTSYTLRENLNELKQYLLGSRLPYYSGNNYSGMIEGTILAIMANFSERVKGLYQAAFNLKDRAGTSRADPITYSEHFRIAYLPKGITDYQVPIDTLLLDQELTSKIQREVIKENAVDSTLPNDSPDKTVTIKAVINPTDPEILHIYFNKKSPQTIRRIIYKSLDAMLAKSDFIKAGFVEGEAVTFYTIAMNFFRPTENSLENILQCLEEYIEEHLRAEEEHLIKDFATMKQKAMNQTRKAGLKYQLDRATSEYQNNMAQFSRLKKNYLEAKKDYDCFEEIPFDAIEVFLNKIKEHPGTKFFGRLQQTNLQFLIEEPLIHTESETWAKYLTNKNSNLNQRLDDFARLYSTTYDTTYDILRYAVARLFKELFVDQKIKLYTAAMLGITSNDTDFRINKYSLNTNMYFPHPHIGGNGLTCWSEATRAIENEILDNDGETAFLQLTYALQQMTASDYIVSDRLVTQIINTDYKDLPIYLKKEETEKTTFNEIIKEFVADETNKINNIIDSES